MIETVPILTPHLLQSLHIVVLLRSFVRVMKNWFSKLMTQEVERAKGKKMEQHCPYWKSSVKVSSFGICFYHPWRYQSDMGAGWALQ